MRRINLHVKKNNRRLQNSGGYYLLRKLNDAIGRIEIGSLQHILSGCVFFDGLEQLVHLGNAFAIY